jgi:tripartite-type tricarboxylate transporter receptor subunit TctC
MIKRLLLAVAAALAIASAAAAQDYPARRIRLITPSSAGSATDILARFVAQKMTERWGQQVIVDNRVGAGSVLGTTLGAQAPADGYTLTMATSSAFSINPVLRSNLPYDAIRDFAPISNLAMTPQTLVAHPAAEFKTVKEFIAATRDKPGQINFATLNVGSTSHMAMELFRSVTGIRVNHVPFKASTEANTQTIGGAVPVLFDAIPAVLPHVKSGRLRGLGIAAVKRSLFMPEVPAIAEAGFAGFEAVGWIGLVAPAKTPPAILDKLNAEMLRIISQPDVKEKFDTLAYTPAGNTRSEFAAYLKSEIAKWGKVAQETGVRAE